MVSQGHPKEANMRQRECDKAKESFVPKSTKARFQQGEIELMLTMRAMGHNGEDVRKAINEKFNTNRSYTTIMSKYCSMKKNGVNVADKRPLAVCKTEYQMPDNNFQACSQLNIAVSIMQNVMQFLEKSKEFEMKNLSQFRKLERIKEMLEVVN